MYMIQKISTPVEHTWKWEYMELQKYEQQIYQAYSMAVTWLMLHYVTLSFFIFGIFVKWLIVFSQVISFRSHKDDNQPMETHMETY